MADIALVFHWGPEAMKAMGIGELMRWHHLATERMGWMAGRPGSSGV